MKYFNADQMNHFQNDGYLLIESFLSKEEVAWVKADIERVCEKNRNLQSDENGFNLEKADDSRSLDPNAPILKPGLLRKIQGAVFQVPAVKDVFASKKMLDCMEDLMGPNLYYHSSKVMFKAANGGAAKPWHQDAAYWKNYDPKQITVWIALDDASEENGCVWAIPGSHKLGLIPHVHQELQVEESRIDLKKTVPVPVKPGGLLIFHSLVLHMSKKNTSDKNRCAIICDYDCSPNPMVDGPQGADRKSAKIWALREDGKVNLATTIA